MIRKIRINKSSNMSHEQKSDWMAAAEELAVECYTDGGMFDDKAFERGYSWGAGGEPWDIVEYNKANQMFLAGWLSAHLSSECGPPAMRGSMWSWEHYGILPTGEVVI